MELPVTQPQNWTVQTKVKLESLDMGVSAWDISHPHSRPGSGRVAHAVNSTQSSLVAGDDWPIDHLTYDSPHRLFTADTLLEHHANHAPFLYGSSGLTCIRYDEALPMLPSQLSFGALSHHSSGNWEQNCIDTVDNATATSPMSRLPAGSMFGHLDMTDLDFGSQTAAIHEGPPRPTALTPLALQATALTAGGPHHLQQFQHGFGSSQLHLSLHQLPLSHMPSTPLQHAAERQLQQLAQECDDHATWFRTEALPAKDMQEALRLQWHNLVPQDPPPGGLFQPPLCFSDAALQVMQLSAFHAEGQPSTSRAYSEASGDRHTSSTGFSHSPPRSPRLKRPGSRNTNLEYTIDSYHNTEGVVSDRLSPDTDQKPHPLRQASTSHLQPDAPETIDTPDHGHDHAARNIFCKSEPRERAASSVYGLRRLRASPRWAAESAHMSDASLSEEEPAEEDSCSDTEAVLWSRKPARTGGPQAGTRDAVRRRRRPRFTAGDTTCSSQFRGVSKHRLTQRWEASLWLEGRQLYLGGFQTERDAARAYDIAALSCKGPHVLTNYSQECYTEQLQDTVGCSTDEMIAYVRRKSAAFSRGRSKYRGVSGQTGRWEARIGAYCGRKNVSFGVHEDEESAARQYDRALLIEKGRAAKTNFPLPDYEQEAKEFEMFVLDRCGDLTSKAALSMLSKWVLPLASNTAEGGPHPIMPKKKGRGGRPRSHAACTILAEDLRQAVAKP